MSFSKNLTITVRNTIAQLDEPLYVYEKDRNLIMYFKIMDYKYKFDKKPTNVLASVDDIMEAYATIVDPNGYELTRQYGEVIEDEIKFIITDDLIDELNEIGTYRIQFHIKCQHSEFTIPEISFEVLERLKGFRTVTDEGEVGDEILNNSESFIDEEGKLHLVWREGDTISSVRLNQMVEVVNNAVDEEHQRQINEVNRENRANAKLEELETRFSALTTSQQSAAEVIDARDGEVSLKVRLDRDVNTHTEQISNLNKELDRVKKLEESTVSTVETESDFTTVTETSNGYFEDVKLEGKTLTNTVTTYDVSRFSLKNATKQDDGYFKLQYGTDVNDSNVIPRYGVHLYKPNTTYTIVVDIKENTTGTFLGISTINSCINSTTISVRDFTNLTGISTITFKTRDDITISDNGVTPTYDLYFGIRKDGGDLSKHITFKYWVLEGDHTQNPPSFFEGLKSVGQDVDEIVVSSVKGDGNLVEYIELNGVSTGDGGNYTDSKYVRTNYITVEPNQTYYAKLPTNALYKSCTVYFYGLNKYFLGYKSGLTSKFTTVANTKFIRIDMKKADGAANTQEDINNCDFVVSKCKVSEYIPYQSDKKRLLYYNEETQTWEKPILREWDSIEKHSNGKYYYHQRSGEVVLNGSENWNGNYLFENAGRWACQIPNMRENSLLVCDKFINKSNDNGGAESIFATNKLLLTLSNDKGNPNTWLQTNNVTVVYQLAEEKVYECTNIDLITYANETNYIVECGAIVPKTTLKVHSNIANVISALQKKVSVLESNYVTLFNTITVTFNSLE